ncbi:hypothetical protein DPMN_079635 [Dreissena polymorpha]|uniref:Uncharacterized protein n=1 Tax=Dreissena polymorpha TaxID=45954 RepID=A0A9D3YPW3_DREPO|nr:hypothetical protein DPMN_079635 [Dreissena polymorpha]
MAEYNLHQTSTRVNKPQLKTITITEPCRGGYRKYCPKDSPNPSCTIDLASRVCNNRQQTTDTILCYFANVCNSYFNEHVAGSEIDSIQAQTLRPPQPAK